jgi:hypothetical protein
LVDHVLGAEMVANKVLVAAEEEDGHVGEEVGEEGYSGGRVSSTEGARDAACAFGPAGFLLVRVDIEGTDDVSALGIRLF